MTRAIKRREIMARRSRINTDAKPIRKIDIVSVSKDELIEYLCQTIQYEVEKGDDADCDLIRECSDWLDELTLDVISFTPEELKAKLDAIKNSNSTSISSPQKTLHTSRITKRKIFARATILVASLILLSFLSLSVMAKYEGYNSAWEYIVSNINQILGLKPGDELSSDGITVIMYSESLFYENMDEFIEKEKINIMYPHVMPGDSQITKITFVQENSNNYVMYFMFSNDYYEFNISNYYSLAPENTYECITINSFNYYIQIIDDNLYYAMLQHDGFEYTIQAPSYDDLLIILNNMKG